MDTLLLCAGLGTRLDPLTRVRAKPALPVAGEPLVRRIVRGLVDQGVTRIVVNLHHRPDSITAVLGDGQELGATIRYSWEQPRVLGSAGGPRQALPILGAETFLIVNGDTLTDAPLGEIVDAHRRSGALVTLAVVPNGNPAAYGGVRMAPDGRVLGFVPRGPRAERSYHFIGVQVAHREAFAACAPGEPARSIGGIYEALIAARPGSIHGVTVSATFLDIGTVADYWRTSWSLARQEPAPPTAAHTRPHATRSIVWNDVSFGEDATVDECIVTDRVRVPAGVSFRRSILIRGTGDEIVAIPFAPESA